MRSRAAPSSRFRPRRWPRAQPLQGRLHLLGSSSGRIPPDTEERRDLFIAANARFHLRFSGAIRLEPLVGFAVVRREAWSQVDRYFFWNSTFYPGTREKETLPAGVGFAAGADVRIGGRRFAILPSFRMFRMTVSDDFANHYPGGVSGWTIRPAVMFRIDMPAS